MSLLGYSVSTAVGRVAPGEQDSVWAPRSPRRGRCGLILCHGSGSPAGFIDVVAQQASVRLAAALATAGIPCVAGDFAGQSWANDTAMTRIDQATALLRSSFNVDPGKVCLLGASMGGALVARYSQLHPDRVAAVVGLIPLWDLTAFYAAASGPVQAEIATAWGVTAPAALPVGANIAAGAPAAKGIPTLAGYSTADTTVLPAWVTSYSATVGAAARVIDTTAGHSDAAIAGMPAATVGAFLAAAGA